jgi:hypothetical protein
MEIRDVVPDLVNIDGNTGTKYWIALPRVVREGHAFPQSAALPE